MKRKEQPAQPAEKKSAREQYNDLGDIHERQIAQRRQMLHDQMSENIHRLGLWLPKIMQDEMELRARRNSLDEQKLLESGCGGYPLESIPRLRIGVNVMQIDLSYYGKEVVEAMPGFRQFVRACASDEVDMRVEVRRDPDWCCNIIEVHFDAAFDRNGPYKDLLAPPKPAVQGRRPKTI